jgi:Ricin-type beta-trefoil lectin domain
MTAAGHIPASSVEVYPCNGGNAQKSTIGPGGQLQSVDSSGFCADDTNFGTSDGSKIQLWYCVY